MKLNIALSKVPLSLAKLYVAGWNKQRYENLFLQFEHSPNKYRIYLPLVGTEVNKKVKIPQKVLDEVQNQGYIIEDYLAGIAVKADDPKKKVKIGKLVAKQPLVKKEFDNDPQRNASKNVKQWVVISRHPYDLSGMSFDRGWTSCMNIKTGEYKKHIRDDIREGTLVAYLIKDTDKNINNPTARILIKPFYNGKHLMLSPESSRKVYGSAPRTFLDTILDWCAKVNKGLPKGVYKMPDSLYDDDSKGTIINYGVEDLDYLFKDVPEDQFAAFVQSVDTKLLDAISKHKQWKNHYYLTVREAAMKNPNASTAVLAQGIKDEYTYVVRQAIGNPNITTELLKKAFNAKSSHYRMWVLQSPKIDQAIIQKALKDRVADVREVLFTNPVIPTDIMQIGLKSKSVEDRCAAARNINCPAELLAQVVNDKNEYVRYHVAGNANATAEILTQLVDDADSEVRQEVAENPNCTAELLLKLVKDKHPRIRMKAADNANADLKVLEIAVKDPSELVRAGVARNLNATPEMVETLSNDVDEFVIGYVVQRPDVTPDQLIKGINCIDFEILRAIYSNPNLPASELIKGMKTKGSAVRKVIIENITAPIEVLKLGIKDKDANVRLACVESMKITPELLLIAAKDPIARIKQAAKEHVKYPKKAEPSKKGKTKGK